jgi:hypothetical protein
MVTGETMNLKDIGMDQVDCEEVNWMELAQYYVTSGVGN